MERQWGDAGKTELCGQSYVVIEYEARHFPYGHGVCEQCTLRSPDTGHTIEGVTCTGMGLYPGDELVIKRRK